MVQICIIHVQGCSGNFIYSAYCGCSELVVRIASMGKLPDLEAFNRRQIVGARSIDHSISEIFKQLGFSRSTVSRVCQEYIDGGQKKPTWRLGTISLDSAWWEMTQAYYT
ncbi:hypothetical protein TNCV_2173391 [Trichonephila clavipes]|nr:hypothetical protein TNCV_2173391 [Trichonephila clavipes]